MQRGFDTSFNLSSPIQSSFFISNHYARIKSCLIVLGRLKASNEKARNAKKNDLKSTMSGVKFKRWRSKLLEISPLDCDDWAGSALLRKALRCSFTKRCHSETGGWHAGAATMPALTLAPCLAPSSPTPVFTKSNQICWFLQSNGENPSRLGRIGWWAVLQGGQGPLRTYLGWDWFAPTPHTPMRKLEARGGGCSPV